MVIGAIFGDLLLYASKAIVGHMSQEGGKK